MAALKHKIQIGFYLIHFFFIAVPILGVLFILLWALSGFREDLHEIDSPEWVNKWIDWMDEWRKKLKI